MDNLQVDEQTSGRVDWFIFSAGLVILISIVVTIVAAPQLSSIAINQVYEFVTTRLGAVYVLCAVGVLVFLLWIAFSRHGSVVLGDGVKPSHSHFGWAAMLFCAGIGASLIYWGATEWTFYYIAPPFGVEPRSDEAIYWAVSYGMFHWGPVGWAFYCLPAVALGYCYHVKRIPSLRLSTACHAVLKTRTDRWPGRVIDLLFIVGLLGTAATGLGFGTSVVASAVTRLTGLEDGLAMQVVIVLLTTCLIAVSVFRGLDRGIKQLSKINVSLALVFIAFVFFAGPTTFIVESGITSLGTVSQNFLKMVTWADPFQRSSFVEDWTVFYWAWWIAMGPFVGMFVCKISEGRTLRELILGMLGWGSLGCTLFFVVLGNYALSLELNGSYAVVEESVNVSPSAAIAGVVSLLPMGQFWLVFIALIGLIFIATTYDSASYTLAAGATRYMAEHEHPARWHRLFWAGTLGILPVSLLFVGGLRELQTASLVASVPLLAVYVLLAASIWRMLSESKEQ